jgi:hypothetical protein
MNGTPNVATGEHATGPEPSRLAQQSALLEEGQPTESAFSPFFSSTGSYSEWLRSLGETPDMGTAVFQEIPEKKWVSLFGVQQVTQQPKEQRAIPDRIALLARKYALKDRFSDEEAARLAIVTERVRQLLPAVTSKDFELLEDVLQSLKTVSDDDAELRKSLGLDE